MPKTPKDIVLAVVPNKLMSALRAYWTVMDLDLGSMATHFWDLRYGMVNRWQAEDVRSPHIRYGLAFKRGDELEDIDYAEKHGAFPPPPEAWAIVFRPGTFPEHWNQDFDVWINANMPAIAKIEDRDGPDAAWGYVRKHGPPETLPNPENWTPEQAASELQETMPKAMELYESDRQPIDWKVKRFIVSPPEEE
jgi:hypothetical protein